MGNLEILEDSIREDESLEPEYVEKGKKADESHQVGSINL